jgi:hypothetical protein
MLKSDEGASWLSSMGFCLWLAQALKATIIVNILASFTSEFAREVFS